MTDIRTADVSRETTVDYFDATNCNVGTGLLDGPSDLSTVALQQEPQGFQTFCNTPVEKLVSFLLHISPFPANNTIVPHNKQEGKME